MKSSMTCVVLEFSFCQQHSIPCAFPQPLPHSSPSKGVVRCSSFSPLFSVFCRDGADAAPALGAASRLGRASRSSRTRTSYGSTPSSTTRSAALNSAWCSTAGRKRIASTCSRRRRCSKSFGCRSGSSTRRLAGRGATQVRCAAPRTVIIASAAMSSTAFARTAGRTWRQEVERDLSKRSPSTSSASRCASASLRAFTLENYSSSVSDRADGARCRSPA